MADNIPGASAANDSAFQTLVNLTLNLKPEVQDLINIAAQAAKWPVSNKWRPGLVEAMSIMNRLTNPAIFEPGPRKALAVLSELLHVALQEWMKPNIGGVVIDATSEVVGRQVDISENMIIIQSNLDSSREYSTDNTAPHPRTWSIQGYLSQNIPWVDEQFILRPSLILQQAMLDAFAKSRRPVRYRSGLCPLPTSVLLESYQLTRLVEGTQAYAVNLELREFVTYTVPFYNRGTDEINYTEPTSGITQATTTAPPPGV